MSVKIPGRDDATLVKPASEVDHNLAGAMVVNHLNIFYMGAIVGHQTSEIFSAFYLKLADVAVLHHHSEETDDHLGARPAEKLNQI